MQEMPMAPAKRLAEEIGRSTPTVISWLKKLARDKMFLGVKPDLKVHLLGLEIYDFLLDVTNHEALLRIEEFCEKHSGAHDMECWSSFGSLQRRSRIFKRPSKR